MGANVPQRTHVNGHVSGSGLYAHASVAGSAGPESLTTLSQMMPPVVYFIRAPGLIKIGHTTDLHTRRRNLRVQWTDVLAWLPGSRADETAMHHRFKAHLAKGNEWFYPHADIFGVINEIRAGWGVDPVFA